MVNICRVLLYVGILYTYSMEMHDERRKFHVALAWVKINAICEYLLATIGKYFNEINVLLTSTLASVIKVFQNSVISIITEIREPNNGR